MYANDPDSESLDEYGNIDAIHNAAVPIKVVRK